jgi:hypothetical protein
MLAASYARFVESAQDRNGQVSAYERPGVFIEGFEVRRRQVRIESFAAHPSLVKEEPGRIIQVLMQDIAAVAGFGARWRNAGMQRSIQRLFCPGFAIASAIT